MGELLQKPLPLPREWEIKMNDLVATTYLLASFQLPGYFYKSDIPSVQP